jgi:hypothetical protein
MMRVLKLHHPTGHPYWKAGEFKVERPDGTFVDIRSLCRYTPNESFEVFVAHNGDIMLAECNCSSGGGKVRYYNPEKPWAKDYEWAKPIVLVARAGYDRLEYVGAPLEMSMELKQDLIDNPFNKE